jgi:AcrR family transcriptional regulator
MKTYHHGDLKKDLIEKGLIVLNTYGPEGFSLRKVAAACGVSHTAPYKHFKNKEELILAISAYVNEVFAEALDTARNSESNVEDKMVAVGVHYVMFMVNNPDYYKYLFRNDDYKVMITNDTIHDPQDPVFRIFFESAIEFMKYFNLPPSTYTNNIISMWAMVQGLSVLFSGVMTTDRDISELVREILITKLKFY